MTPITEESIARALCKADGTAQCAAICLSHTATFTRDGQCPEASRVWSHKARAVLALLPPAETGKKLQLSPADTDAYPCPKCGHVQHLADGISGICPKCNYGASQKDQDEIEALYSPAGREQERIAELERERDDWRDSYYAAKARTEAEVARIRAEIAPLDELVRLVEDECYIPCEPDNASVGWSDKGPLPMTFGHIRRARKAIRALTNGGNPDE